ncbi:hypothetical protein V6N13_047194 [Hibiscus sabdariffa]
MSFATDSPVHSSSSDDFAALIDAELEDFAALIDAELEAGSSGSSPDERCNEEEEADDDFNDHRNKRRKTEKLEDQVEPQGSTSQGLIEEKLEVSLKDICTHPGSFRQMCITCGQRVDEESGVTFGYIHKGLRLGNDEIVRLRSTDMKNLLRHKKLYLVLDLDHTLLNSTQLNHLTSEEEYLKAQSDSLQGGLFTLEFMHMMTKLRPFIGTFLKEASKMFEMYIYTMGDRSYALEMAKLLDPKKEYFSGRVISRDDGTHRDQKALDVILGQESAVLIVDDTEKVWTKHKDNMILMERYHFFASSCQQFGFNCKSLSQLKTDESAPYGALASVLKVLQQIHHIFFNELDSDLASRDVRQVLKTVRKEVLKDCKLVFSRVFPTKFQAENHLLWKTAEQLGATCSTETSSSVTHVVSMDAGTEKSRWAVKENKFLVHPRWIEAANFLWQKQPEENFPLNQRRKMAATSDLYMDSILSGFDQIYEDFKRRIEEIQLLKSNWNAEIKRGEALEITCDSLKQGRKGKGEDENKKERKRLDGGTIEFPITVDNARLTKLYTESLNNFAEQLENHAECQRLKEGLQRMNDEYLSKEEDHRKAMELIKKDHAKEVADLEAKVRGLLLEKATNEAAINQLRKDLAAHKGHAQVLSKKLDQLQSDEESKYLLEIWDLKDCLMVEQEEKNEMIKKLQEAEKELLISRTKLGEQQQDSASSRQVETLKLKIMKLRKENEILKRKLSSMEAC